MGGYISQDYDRELGRCIFFYFYVRFLKFYDMILKEPTERTYMLTRAQIDEYIKEIPSDIDADERRAAYATITGFAEDKSINEISSYYSLNKDSVMHWMNYFNLTSSKGKTSGKKSSKSTLIEKYLSDNVGKVINFTKVAEELNVSVPTVYNFYNANRSYFKKVSRGNFEILDPKAERSK